MEAGLWGGLVLAILVVLGLREVMVAAALLKMALRPVRPRSLTDDEVPASLQDGFVVAARWLEPHGFRVLGFMEGYDVSAPSGAELPPALVMVDDRGTFAHVSFQLPCDAAFPFNILLVTEFHDGSAFVTANALEHVWLGDPPGRTTQHVWTIRLDEQLTAHGSAVADRTARGEAREAMDLDEFRILLGTRANDLLAKMAEQRIVVRDASTDASHLRLVQAFRRGRKLMQGMGRMMRLRKERAAAIKAGTLEGLELIPIEVEIAGAELTRQFQEAPLPKRAGHLLFIASIALSLAGALIWFDAKVVVALFITLFIHEGGHYIAMRLCGHSDAKVFFVPMMGAVTVARPRPTSTSQEVLILLAGPLPGLLLALGLGLWPIAALGSLGNILVFWLAAINFFNLLPIMPLDGGKVFERVVLGKSPYAGFAFSIFSALGLATLSIFTGDGVLLGFLLLLVLGWPRKWRTAKLKRLLGAQLTGPLSKDRLVDAFTLLSRDKQLAARDKLGVIRSLAPHWGRIHAGWPVRVAWGSGYVACLVGSGAMLPFVLGATAEPVSGDSKAQNFSCLAPNLSQGAGGTTLMCNIDSATEPAIVQELNVYSSLRWEMPCLRAPWQYSADTQVQRQRDLELRSWAAGQLPSDDADEPEPASVRAPLPAGLDEAQRALLEGLTASDLERDDVARSLSAVLGEIDDCEPQEISKADHVFAAFVGDSKLRVFTTSRSDAELNEIAGFLCREGLSACSFRAHGKGQ